MNNLPKEQINGKWYQPVADKGVHGCSKCAFQNNCREIDANCCETERSDGIAVHFIEVQNEERA